MYANHSWDEFELMLDKVPRGNFGYMGTCEIFIFLNRLFSNKYENKLGIICRIISIVNFVGLFFDEEEILPRVQGDFRFDKMSNLIKQFPSPETEIRALVEGQLIAKRAHAEDLGFKIGTYVVHESLRRLIDSRLV